MKEETKNNKNKEELNGNKRKEGIGEAGNRKKAELKKIKQDKYIASLAIIGAVSGAMEKAGVKSRGTLTSWRKKTEGFIKREVNAMEGFKLRMGDIVLTKIKKAILENKWEAIRYWADRQMPEFKPKSQFDVTESDREDIDKLEKRLLRIEKKAKEEDVKTESTKTDT